MCVSLVKIEEKGAEGKEGRPRGWLSPGCTLPLGLAPRIARFTFAFLPSMIGLGSLHALSAAGRSPIITCNIQTMHVRHEGFYHNVFKIKILIKMVINNKKKTKIWLWVRRADRYLNCNNNNSKFFIPQRAVVVSTLV